MDGKFLQFCNGIYNSERLSRIETIVLLSNTTHPLCCSHSHCLLEGGAECAITAEATLIGELLGYYRLMGSESFIVEFDEVLDAQTVDVGIVGNTLHGKVLTEIDTISTNQLGELGYGNVMLQIELRVLAMLLQQSLNVIVDGKG